MAGNGKNQKMTGSYYTIMGLPTHLVYKILKEI
jgi:septum formation protein